MAEGAPREPPAPAALSSGRLILLAGPQPIRKEPTLNDRRDTRPWGHFEILDDAPAYKVKRIEVLPGARLSLQLHHLRTEHWFVVVGRGLATCAGEEFPLGPGESIDIPQGAAHRMANPGSETLVFVEVQRGDYFGEDDIERLQDDFGRE